MEKENAHSYMHPYGQTLCQSMNSCDKIPVAVKNMSSVPLLKLLYQKYPPCCLTGDRALLPVNSYQS